MHSVSIQVKLIRGIDRDKFQVIVFNSDTLKRDFHIANRSYSMSVCGEAYTVANAFFKRLGLPGEIALAPANGARDKWVGVAI